MDMALTSADNGDSISFAGVCDSGNKMSHASLRNGHRHLQRPQGLCGWHTLPCTQLSVPKFLKAKRAEG